MFLSSASAPVRKAAQKQLAQAESRYRGLLEAAPDAMVVVNEGGVIELLNAQLENGFGYQRTELVGRKVTTIIPRGFAERLAAELRPEKRPAHGVTRKPCAKRSRSLSQRVPVDLVTATRSR